MAHAPLQLRKRVLPPRQRLWYGLTLAGGITLVFVGWISTMRQEIGVTAHAVRNEWQGAQQATGTVVEGSGMPEVLSTVRTEVVDNLRPALQTIVQGRAALETVSGIMKETLYEQTQTARAEQ